MFSNGYYPRIFPDTFSNGYYPCIFPDTFSNGYTSSEDEDEDSDEDDDDDFVGTFTDYIKTKQDYRRLRPGEIPKSMTSLCLLSDL